MSAISLGQAPTIADANAVLLGVFSKAHQQVHGMEPSRTSSTQQKQCILL
ncbi:MAG: hypothetical protein ACOYKZ_07150 [Chlamydiia bacterium]